MFLLRSATIEPQDAILCRKQIGARPRPFLSSPNHPVPFTPDATTVLDFHEPTCCYTLIRCTTSERSAARKMTECSMGLAKQNTLGVIGGINTSSSLQNNAAWSFEDDGRRLDRLCSPEFTLFELGHLRTGLRCIICSMMKPRFLLRMNPSVHSRPLFPGRTRSTQQNSSLWRHCRVNTACVHSTCRAFTFALITRRPLRHAHSQSDDGAMKLRD